MRYFKLKMHQNSFSAGGLPRMSLRVGGAYNAPQTLWGGAHPPYSRPLDAFGVRF